MEEVLGRLRAYAAAHNVPIMLDDGIKLLEKTVKECAPREILEVGTAIGYSGLRLLAAAGDDARLTTVEIDEDRLSVAKRAFSDAGVSDRVTTWAGDAVEILRLATGEFDFILLDSSKGHYAELLPYLLGLLKRGGVLFADNIAFKGKTDAEGDIPHKHRTIVRSLREYVKRVTEDENLKTTYYDVGDGVTVTKKLR